jgi:hypothetical protein
LDFCPALVNGNFVAEHIEPWLFVFCHRRSLHARTTRRACD